MEFRKMVNNNPVYETAKETLCIEQFFGLYRGGVIWENGIKTYIISYKK